MSFAANEGNQYDCRRPQVPNSTHLTPADARRNDACMDAPGWMATTNGQPMPRTWAEKEQRKALWMKAVWRSHAGCSEAVRCEGLRPTASRRQHLRTQDARSAGSESRVAKWRVMWPSVGEPYRTRTGDRSWADRHIVARHSPRFRHDPFWHEPRVSVKLHDTLSRLLSPGAVPVESAFVRSASADEPRPR